MIDLKALLGTWSRGSGKNRFEVASLPDQMFNPFDIPTELIDDMMSRNISPFTVMTINLTTAGSQVIRIPGFHIVGYGTDNTANRAVNTTAYAEMFWGESIKQTQGFPLKHGRGYSGPFQAVTLKWPAQANVYMDLVIHSGMFNPWIDGESCT